MPPRKSAPAIKKPDDNPAMDQNAFPALSVRLRALSGGEVAFGPGKCELLDALAQTGSITGAARTLGISYMHAWSLVQTMNRCFTKPLVHSARGGQKGGGARLTKEGKAMLTLYREMAAAALQAAAPAWRRLRPKLKNASATEDDAQFSIALSTAKDDDDLMEQSIRNELPGTVKEIISDKVLSEVIVETAIGEMASVITTRSVKEMNLKVGDKVAALVKATNVSLRRQS